MQTPVPLTDKGFTIIEFMISVFLLTVALFGLLTTLNMAMNANMETSTRKNAIGLADEYISMARSVRYQNLFNANTMAAPNTGVVGTATRQVMVGGTNVTYTVATTVNAIGANSSSVTVTVTWPIKGVVRNYQLTTSVSNPT